MQEIQSNTTRKPKNIFKAWGIAILFYVFYFIFPVLLSLVISSEISTSKVYKISLLIISLLIFVILSYNFYYLKTEIETQGIYGLLEVLFAMLSFIVLSLPSIDIEISKNFYFILLKNTVLIYVPIYVMVRGFELIGKKYKYKEVNFAGLKFGTDESGKAIYYSNIILKPALCFEKHIKEYNSISPDKK